MTSPGQFASRNNASSASRDAALLGATTAFARSPSTSPTAQKTIRLNNPKIRPANGARVFSASGQHTPSQQQIRRPSPNPPLILTYDHGKSAAHTGQRRKSSVTATTPVLPSPHSSPIVASHSPFAHGTITPARAGLPLSSPIQHSNDHFSYPSTSTLVNQFEQRSATPKQRAVTAPIQSPRPIRKSLLLSKDPLPLLPAKTTRELVTSTAQDRVIDEDKTPADRFDGSSSPDSFRSAKDVLSPVKLPRQSSPLKPKAPPTRRSGTGNLQKKDQPVSTHKNPDVTIQSTSTEPIPIRRPPPRLTPSPFKSSGASSPSITAAYHQLHPRRKTPLTTDDSLANALVASSLASSRAPSPTKLPPLQVQKHRPNAIFGREISPAKKGLRQTMRKASTTSNSSDDEDPYSKHKKKRHLRKHPNKHHEGDRKRWRNAVTEKERKRYEGIWATNKGLHVSLCAAEQETISSPYTSDQVSADLQDLAAEQVSGIIVKDIWSRSRLPEHVLQQVWDLVDGQGIGRLTREEFAVGLWLIDQRLKGRKLPLRVNETVWNSVKFLQGIKIRK